MQQDEENKLIDVGQDWQRRFGGIERVYGDGALPRFAQTVVAVVGLGGVGTWAAEALARTGFARIRLIDLDHIAPSNTNRQLHALDGNFGKSKIVAMQERIQAINPCAQSQLFDEFLDAENVDQLLEGCDAVIDCVDQVSAKAAIVAWARRHQAYVVVCGGAGGRTDPTRIQCDDLARSRGDALLSQVRQVLRKQYGFPAGQAKSSPRFGVTAVFSEEDMVQAPACDPLDAPPGSPLACGGFGSVVTVTATMGFIAAAKLINHVASLDEGQARISSQV